MKTLLSVVFALSAVAAPALAQTKADTAPVAGASTSAAAVKRGSMIYLVDGHRIGRVDRLRDNSVGVIYNGKYVLIPTATLSAAASGGFTTTLTKRDLSAL